MNTMRRAASRLHRGHGKRHAYWNSEVDGVEDYDLWLKLRKQGKLFYNVSDIQVMHRIHNDSFFNAKGNHLKVNYIKSKYA